MKIIFVILTLLLSITLLLTITLFIWDKFFDKDQSTKQVDTILEEREEIEVIKA